MSPGHDTARVVTADRTGRQFGALGQLRLQEVLLRVPHAGDDVIRVAPELTLGSRVTHSHPRE